MALQTTLSRTELRPRRKSESPRGFFERRIYESRAIFITGPNYDSHRSANRLGVSDSINFDCGDGTQRSRNPQ